MTANNERARQSGGQDPAQDPETARAEANARAAAEEAARIAEEAAGEDATPEETTPEPAEEAPEAQEAPDEVTALQEQVGELKDRLQRAVAEAENVRRRADRERQETMKYAGAALAGDLLGVADNLRRALESVPQEAVQESQALQSLLSGVEMTEKELADVLRKHNVEKIEVNPGDRFDPHVHEAMFEIPTDAQAPGTVVQVVQTGYKLHDRLLRPARVGVAKSAGGGAGGANGNGQGVDTKV